MSKVYQCMGAEADPIIDGLEEYASESAEPTRGDLTAAIISLANQREAVIEQLKVLDEQMEVLLLQLPPGEMFQDISTKVVYKVVVPEGRFVFFKKIDYARTRKTLEEKGSLSMTDAQEAGFDLGELGPKKKGK